MLTISQVAARYRISNRQVYDLINYGYLNVASVSRHGQKGISYLFSENELNQLDIPSLLADIKDNKKPLKRHSPGRISEFRQLFGVVNYYDNFMKNVTDYPESAFLKACFYLFHANHYAKTYPGHSNRLYSLKNQVLRKACQDNPALINAIYLLGPDRRKIWLCEDCKDAARTSGMSYNDYIRKEYYCPKCTVQSVVKEYYSLIEFNIQVPDYRFTFHVPRSSAQRWLPNLDELPQGIRKTGHYDDKMFIYGRPISRVEERVFPLPMVEEQLQLYLSQ